MYSPRNPTALDIDELIKSLRMTREEAQVILEGEYFEKGCKKKPPKTAPPQISFQTTQNQKVGIHSLADELYTKTKKFKNKNDLMVVATLLGL